MPKLKTLAVAKDPVLETLWRVITNLFTYDEKSSTETDYKVITEQISDQSPVCLPA